VSAVTFVGGRADAGDLVARLLLVCAIGRSNLINERVSRAIIGAAIEVHRALGPGLLESIYEACLALEMRHRGLAFKQQVPLPVVYRGVTMVGAYRADFDVADEVIVELKACETLTSAHRAQILTYLRVSRRRVGLLINFHAATVRAGLERFVLDP
jgi:GxxExxY protein